MANIFDYLKWRGDLSFDSAPFNEVDSLIFCTICTMALGPYVPGPGGGSVTVGEASRAYALQYPKKDVELGVLISPEVPRFFRLLADSPRFRGLGLSRWVDQVADSQAMQFAAVTVTLPDGSRYIAFRGTDDTIAGWKENFMMSFVAAVPAQRAAALYLAETAGVLKGALRMGGHSKGGNLAVYAAMTAPPDIQSRILEVFNNDGPGFGVSVMEDPGYLRVREKIHTLLPQSSMVGILLEHEEDYEVVRSSGVGPNQHDGFTWEVLGPGFVHLPELSGFGRRNDAAIKAWVDEVPTEQRVKFTQALFDLLESTGARTLTELTGGKLRTAAALIKNWRSLDKETQEMLTHVIKLLIVEETRIKRQRSGD